MSGPSSDDRRRADDASPRGEPASQLSDLRRRAPTGDHRAVEELLTWARRRADEILASLSPDSELLELLRTDDPPPTSPIPRGVPSGGTRQGIPIPAPVAISRVKLEARRPIDAPPSAPRKPTLLSHGTPRPVPERTELVLDALPPAAASDDVDHSRVPALRASPVATLLPRLRPAREANEASPPPPERRHPRYSLEHPVAIQYDQWSELVELCTRDISKGGMFVKTAEPPPLRSKVTVRVQLPRDAGTLELSGEVVHVMGGGDGGPVIGFGLQFDELGERRRAMLDRLVEHAREMAERPSAQGVTLTELGLTTADDDGPSLRLTLTAEELGKMSDLRSELASMAEKDDLSLLGLEGAPSSASVDEAFAALEARWHPGHASTHAAPEVEDLAMDIFRRIEAAYLRVSAAARSREAPRRERTMTPRPAPVEVGELEPRESAAPDVGGIVGRLLEQGGRLAGRLTAATRNAGAAKRISTLEFNKLIGRGFEQLSAKEYRAAISTFQHAVAQRPDSTKAQILLLFAEARLLVADKRIAEARAKYEEVLKIDPENATAQRDLVMLACLG